MKFSRFICGRIRASGKGAERILSYHISVIMSTGFYGSQEVFNTSPEATFPISEVPSRKTAQLYYHAMHFPSRGYFYFSTKIFPRKSVENLRNHFARKLSTEYFANKTAPRWMENPPWRRHLLFPFRKECKVPGFSHGVSHLHADCSIGSVLALYATVPLLLS
jgi:hypothetical protein